MLTSAHSSNSLLNTCLVRLYTRLAHAPQAKGFSFLELCFSVGLFVGPILGGELLGAAGMGWPMDGWVLKLVESETVSG